MVRTGQAQLVRTVYCHAPTAANIETKQTLNQRGADRFCGPKPDKIAASCAVATHTLARANYTLALGARHRRRKPSFADRFGGGPTRGRKRDKRPPLERMRVSCVTQASRFVHLPNGHTHKQATCLPKTKRLAQMCNLSSWRSEQVGRTTGAG